MTDPLAALRPAITGFAIDHRQVARGNVFGAFPGAARNGEDFIPAAVAAGAIAVVARPSARVDGALHVRADNPRAAFAALAAPFFAPFPATTVAVTGTNGKTSTVELVRQLWHLAGERAASLGTLGVTSGEDRSRAGMGGLTTPDIVTFLSVAGGLAREGVSHFAFEASSHGLDQHRLEGLPVAAGAFTNLTRDHLDYHGDMDRYFAAKRRLVDAIIMDGGAAVIWLDQDAQGAEWNRAALAAARARGLAVLTVGPDGEDLRLVRRLPTLMGQTLGLEGRLGTATVQLPLIGGYQASNALVAAALAIATGSDAARTLADLGRVAGVRGRLERAAVLPSGAAVYVDYAHTPDALEAALAALRPHTANRLILVFGCGGDRDPGKRPLMGAIAARDADAVIITDDNPRSEDPAAIRSAIRAAAPRAAEIGERRAAISAALRMADSGDIVIVAGKGHETGQIVGDEVLPFDDAEVVRAAARSLGA